MHIKHMSDQVRNYRRTRAPLWQLVFVTSQLGKYSSYPRLQREVLVFQEEPSNPSKVDTSKKIMQIDVEDVAAGSMCTRVSHDRVISAEAMRNTKMLRVFKVAMFEPDLSKAILQKIRKASLN